MKSHAAVSGRARLPRRTAHMQIGGLMSPVCRTEDRKRREGGRERERRGEIKREGEREREEAEGKRDRDK